MRRGRVIVLSDYVGAAGSASGGAGIAASASFEAMKAGGIDARLVTGFALPAALAGDATAASLGGTDLRAGTRLDAVRGFYNPASRAALRVLLADHDPDRTVIVLHQWTRNLTPSVIALLRPFPLMIYMHDYFWACPNGAYFDFKTARVCTRAPMGASCITTTCTRGDYAEKLARVARHAALGYARRNPTHPRLHLHISRLARATAEPLLPDGRHAVVYNPMAMEAAPGHPGERRPADFDVGYFGRMEPQKGISELIAGLAARGLRGLFAGDGALAAQIAATPRMTLIPWQRHDDMTRLMRRCRMVALPSLWPETWGLVIAEAMAAGVPVLVSARAGAAELVRRFGGGVVFDPGAEGGLGQALGTLKGGGSVASLSAEGRAGLRALLSPAAHAAHLARLAADTWGIDVMTAGAGPSKVEGDADARRCAV